MNDYESQIKKFVVGFSRAIDSNIFYGSQPTELREFPGGTCPSCHGYGGSDGPEQGFPNGWTCDLCGGSGKIGKCHLPHYLPYPEGHPNKGTEYERKGWKA